LACNKYLKFLAFFYGRIAAMKLLISLILMIVIFSSCQHGPSDQLLYPWKPYSKQALEQSIAQHRPVVIDFYADWCPICHELERTVFSLPEIQAKLAQVTALRMDATDQDDPQVQSILQEYEVEGLPTIVFIGSHGQEIKDSRVIGFVTPREFSQALAMFNIFK
jgi:thiol:disulfide interchange protein DsbD